jgi:hypothetical protein
MKNIFKGNLKFFLITLVVISSILLIYVNATPFGPGITADSANYLSIAGNISENLSFTTSITEWDFTGERYWNGYWPPLYPILLVMPVIVGGNLALIIFNGILLGITFLLSYKLLERINHGKPALILLTVLLIGSSKWIVWIFCYIWSETVFIPLVLGYFLLLDDLIRDRNNKNYISVLVVTSLLSLTRYIGVFFFIPIVLFTLPSFFLFSIKRIFYLGLAVLPFFVVLLINYIETTKLFGLRTANNSSFFDLFSTISTGIGKWILGSQSNRTLDVTIVCVFALIIIVSIIAALRKGRGINKLIVVTTAIYILAIIYSALSEQLEKFGFRFISPVFIPAALIVFSSLMNLRRRFFYPILILSFTLSGYVLFSFISTNHAEGVGVFSTKEWKTSATIEYLKKNPIDRNIYSNYSQAITSYTGLSTKIISFENDKVSLMLDKIKRERAVIILINSATRQQPETIELIRKEIRSQPQIKLADGVIYCF